MNDVERAAEVIRQSRRRRGLMATNRSDAQALIDAGMHFGPKLSDADRAVLDAAEAYVYLGCCGAEHDRLTAAVRARGETSP